MCQLRAEQAADSVADRERSQLQQAPDLGQPGPAGTLLESFGDKVLLRTHLG